MESEGGGTESVLAAAGGRARDVGGGGGGGDDDPSSLSEAADTSEVTFSTALTGFSFEGGDFSFKRDFFSLFLPTDGVATTWVWVSSLVNGFDDGGRTFDVTGTSFFTREFAFGVSVDFLAIFGVAVEDVVGVFSTTTASPPAACCCFSFFAPLSPGLTLREVEREKADAVVDLPAEGVLEVELFLPSFL